jgi:hypothetical protein
MLLRCDSQSIFGNSSGVTGSPTSVPASAPTVLPTSTTSNATVSFNTSLPAYAIGFKDQQIQFTYRLITKVSTSFPDARAASSVVEAGTAAQLRQLGSPASNQSSPKIVFFDVGRTKLTACNDSAATLLQYPAYDGCHEAQSIVDVAVDPNLTSAVVKHTVLQEIDRYAAGLNANQTDIRMLVESPLYVSMNLNVFLVPVIGAMSNLERAFFEQLFFKAVQPYLANNSTLPFSLQSVNVVIQDPYDPNANKTHRYLQSSSQASINTSRLTNGAPSAGNLTKIDPRAIPFNNMQVYLQATCANSNCTQANFQTSLYNTSGYYAKDLSLAIQVNRLLLPNSSYFDFLADILVARDPQLADLPVYNSSDVLADDVIQFISTEPPPNWVYILCAVNVGIILIAVLWTVIQSARRDAQEKEAMDKFASVYY